MDDESNQDTFDRYQRGELQVDQPKPPDWTQAAAGPPVWTAADDMRVARKSAGMNQTLNDLDEGAVHPQYAQPLLQDYQTDLSALNQKKQAADAYKMQTATQAALGQAAMARAVQQLDMQHAAQGFQDTMHRFRDPATGEVTNFYQAKPGEWEPIPKKAETPDQGEADLPVGDQQPDTGESDRPVGDQQTQQTAPQRHDLTITNGPYAETVTYENGQIVSRTPMTFSDGKPVPSATAKEADLFGLTPDKMQQIERQANVSSMHIPPGVQRNAHYAHMKQELVSGAMRDDAMQKRQKAALELQGRKEQEAQRREQAKDQAKQQDDHSDKWNTNYKHFLGALETNLERISVKGSDTNPNANYVPPDERPEFLKTREAMEAEAKRRADDAHIEAYGEKRLPESRKAARQKAAETQAQPSQPAAQAPAAPAVKPIPKGLTEAAIDEAIKKKLEAGQPKPDYSGFGSGEFNFYQPG